MNEAKVEFSSKEKEQFEFKVAKAMHLLLSSKPFYYYVLTRLNRSLNPDFQAPAAVVMEKSTFQVKLVLNPIRLRECTPRDLKIVLEHEVLHLCYQHLFNMHKFNAQVYNQATDYIINDNIEDLVARYDELLGPTPSNQLFSKICLAPALKKAIPELSEKKIGDMDSLTLYKILMKNQDKAPQSELMDDHSASEEQGDQSADSSSSSENIPQSVIDKIMSDSAKEAEGHKDKGNIPAAVEARIKEVTKSSTNYVGLLKNFAHSLKQSDKERTWARRNRKYPDQVRGKREVYRPTLVVVIDTSGSMTDPRVQKAIAGEIQACSKICKEMWVIVGDAMETFRMHIKDGNFNPDKLSFAGGGGTNLQFGWDAAKTLKADGVLCYTDGEFYGAAPLTHKIKTMFCIYPNGRDVLGYKNVKMKI